MVLTTSYSFFVTRFEVYFILVPCNFDLLFHCWIMSLFFNILLLASKEKCSHMVTVFNVRAILQLIYKDCHMKCY